MLDLQTYVILLSVISATGMYYIIRVLVKQIKLFRITEEPQIQNFRLKLFTLSLIIIVMGLIPITINVLTLFIDTNRPDDLPLISVIYTTGVHLQSLLLSYILWRIYRLSDNEEPKVHELELKHLDKEERKK